ncbi:MAG: DUF4430 domain-containing protein [Candidatus Kerfeldbacteria bacterium]|nr:DUF4430 domain-containing protein [Candidatus Kerfeldbacteria bacterium]
MNARHYKITIFLTSAIFFVVLAIAVCAHSFSPPTDLSHDLVVVENQHATLAKGFEEEAFEESTHTPLTIIETESHTSTDAAVEQEDEEVPSAETQVNTHAHTNTNSAESAHEQQEKIITVAMHVVPVGADVEDYIVTTYDGDTVYNVMTLAKEDGFAFVEKNFPGIGKYISTILGLKEDKRAGFYWSLYINGKYSSVGVSQATVHDGDTVTWKFERK